MTASATVAEPVTGAAKRLANLRPFPKGTSGNPSGASSLFKVYAAELGELTPVEAVELRRAVKLLHQAARANHNDSVRLHREAREWLDGIRARRAVRKLEPEMTIERYAAMQAAAKDR